MIRPCCCGKPPRNPIARVNAIYNLDGDLVALINTTRWNDNKQGKPCACKYARKAKWIFAVNGIVMWEIGFSPLTTTIPNLGTDSTFDRINIASEQDITDYLETNGVTISNGDVIGIQLHVINCDGKSDIQSGNEIITYTSGNPDTPLNAVFFAWNDGTEVVDTQTSTGDYVRVLVRRGSTVIYTAPYQSNTGINTFDISAAMPSMENGDEIVVQVSNSTAFTVIDEDSNFVPTPGITFLDYINSTPFRISFEENPGVDAFLAPNSVGTDTLVFRLSFVDKDNNVGLIAMTGPKAAFHLMNDANPFTIVPVTGSQTENNAGGTINVVRTFDSNFQLLYNKTIITRLTDQIGLTEVKDDVSITAAIMLGARRPMMLDANRVVTWQTI